MADQPASTITVNSQDFAEKVLQDPQMVVVNFSSDKSSSCQLFAPEFTTVSQEYQGQVTFAQVDVDNEAKLVNQYSIDGIPTLLFFKHGREIHRIKGIVMRDKLRRQIAGTLLVNTASGQESD